MKVYRISKNIYAKDLSGTGAALFGGRWNPEGLPMLYTAGSISLAVLEFLAHNFHLMPKLELSLCVLELPSKAIIDSIDNKDLPTDWQASLMLTETTQNIGAQFIKKNTHYGLKVPSAIVPEEFNVLLNPLNMHHQSIKIIDCMDNFKVDSRLFGTSI